MRLYIERTALRLVLTAIAGFTAALLHPASRLRQHGVVLQLLVTWVAHDLRRGGGEEGTDGGL